MDDKNTVNENNKLDTDTTAVNSKTTDSVQDELRKKIHLRQTGRTNRRIRKLSWSLQERIAYDLVSICLMIVLLYILFHFIIGAALVNGSSMYPTLKNNQLVVYFRLVPEYKAGDIVSVRMPSGEFYVKRIIGVPGDVVDLRDGKLYVNDVEQSEEYVMGETFPEEGMVTYPLTVGEDKYFILGDNRAKSNDSRSFGAVIEKRITGKVYFYAGVFPN